MEKEADLILDREIDIKPFNINDFYKENKQVRDNSESMIIPISIFKNNLSPLETLVRYLKDILGFTCFQMCIALKRSETTIRTTYNNSLKKLDKIVLNIESQNNISFIPLKIYSYRELSVLENLCMYLYSRNMTYSKISKKVNRNEKTVWTVISRAKRKLNEKKE